ncbi:DUF6279 family lipoprotein [Pseudomonas sp. SA3-5]|uniref:DUF6279 family lipoprotein n=1 Tax=Pseudomonas aestuarii TaxID=3018340 RepID=A0ABT4XKM5_9PSED|nr:DUF6279 family lipoprotein [Pseudomonas aestuarii]MDA7088778.1 DUF6279 family lipoprotein [Pseudomonas aestuarii]
MILLRRQRLSGMALLLVASLLLASCSRVSLVYRNLDWLIPWRLNDYLHLNREQKAWLKPRLQAHLAWHCSSELARYLDWLQRLDALLQQPRPDASLLDLQLREVDEALKRVAVQITPTAIELLRMFSDRQVAELFAAIDEDNRELYEEYLEPPLRVQIADRAERMEERLRPWLGSLTLRQRARISQWAAAMGGQNRLWLDNRMRWQEALFEAIRGRHDAAFAGLLSDLLQLRESYFNAEFRAAYPRNRRALAELFRDLLTSADDHQRMRLRRRLHDLQRDLAEQVCAAPLTAD